MIDKPFRSQDEPSLVEELSTLGNLYLTLARMLLRRMWHQYGRWTVEAAAGSRRRQRSSKAAVAARR